MEDFTAQDRNALIAIVAVNIVIYVAIGFTMDLGYRLLDNWGFFEWVFKVTGW